MICVLCSGSIGQNQPAIYLMENTGGVGFGGQYTGYSAHTSCVKLRGSHEYADDPQLRVLIDFNLLAKED